MCLLFDSHIGSATGVRKVVKQGSMVVRTGKNSGTFWFLTNLQLDLLRYAGMNSCASGVIFTKKNGIPIILMQVSLFIQKLICEEKIHIKKGNIRALRQLYNSMISTIETISDLSVH